MADIEGKDMNAPDEARKFENGRLDLVNMGGGTIGRLTLQPGWRWSEHVKPIAKTEWCEAPHFQYQISGRMGVRMSDGTELEIGPGEVVRLGAGHDAWVIGNEAVVVVDWHGASNYALAQWTADGGKPRYPRVSCLPMYTQGDLIDPEADKYTRASGTYQPPFDGSTVEVG